MESGQSPVTQIPSTDDTQALDSEDDFRSGCPNVITVFHSSFQNYRTIILDKLLMLLDSNHLLCVIFVVTAELVTACHTLVTAKNQSVYELPCPEKQT